MTVESAGQCPIRDPRKRHKSQEMRSHVARAACSLAVVTFSSDQRWGSLSEPIIWPISIADMPCPRAPPAALRDLDEQTLQVEQICRRNPHATQLDRRSIIAEHLEKRTGDGGLRAIAPLLCKEPAAVIASTSQKGSLPRK
jgi:hypothetical protein